MLETDFSTYPVPAVFLFVSPVLQDLKFGTSPQTIIRLLKTIKNTITEWNPDNKCFFTSLIYPPAITRFPIDVNMPERTKNGDIAMINNFIKDLNAIAPFFQI